MVVTLKIKEMTTRKTSGKVKKLLKSTFGDGSIYFIP
jgi:hypothetical protein